MVKVTTAVLFGTLVAAATAIAPGVSGTSEAFGPQRSLKGDRLQVQPAGPACVESAWPHDEAKCLRGQTQPAVQRGETRVVALDRLPASLLAAAA